jgi:hypothetical protein
MDLVHDALREGRLARRLALREERLAGHPLPALCGEEGVSAGWTSAGDEETPESRV